MEVEKARQLSIKLGFGIGVFQGLSNFFINSVVLGVIYAGGYMLINNEINAGQLMAYLTATQMIQKSFSQFSILFGQALKGMSSGGRVFEVNKTGYTQLAQTTKIYVLNNPTEIQRKTPKSRKILVF
jgi:ABC-type multidrug transport system fused ATPase/permease subunit